MSEHLFISYFLSIVSTPCYVNF